MSAFMRLLIGSLVVFETCVARSVTPRSGSSNAKLKHASLSQRPFVQETTKRELDGVEETYARKLDKTFGSSSTGSAVVGKPQAQSDTSGNANRSETDDGTLLKMVYHKLAGVSDDRKRKNEEPVRNFQALLESYADYRSEAQIALEAVGVDGSPTATHEDEQAYFDQDQESPEAETSVARTIISSHGLASETNCSRCELMREEARLFRIESIKQEIMKKLQLYRLPNVTQFRMSTQIPEHLLNDGDEEDGMQRDEQERAHHNLAEDDDEDHATIQRILQLATKVPVARRTLNSDALYFEIPRQVPNYKVGMVKLGVYINGDGRQSGMAKVNIFGVSPPNRQNQKSLTFHVSHKVLITGDGRLVRVDVTALVSKWIAAPETNYGLVVKTVWLDGSPAPSVHLSDEDHERRAFLDFRIGPGGDRRRKRELGLECTESSAEERCCRYPFTVDFDEFGEGFDFIITPRRYVANYCAGHCPPTFLPMHANTQLAQVSRRLPANSKQPCCTPRKVEGITMMYLDDQGTYMKGLLPGMVIKNCGCS